MGRINTSTMYNMHHPQMWTHMKKKNEKKKKKQQKRKKRRKRKKKISVSFSQPTRLITCANHVPVSKFVNVIKV